MEKIERILNTAKANEDFELIKIGDQAAIDRILDSMNHAKDSERRYLLIGLIETHFGDLIHNYELKNGIIDGKFPDGSPADFTEVAKNAGVPNHLTDLLTK